MSALNGLLDEVALAARNQQRFLANAAHQLRTPLAGLQAHTELALAQPLPGVLPRADRAGPPGDDPHRAPRQPAARAGARRAGRARQLRRREPAAAWSRPRPTAGCTRRSRATSTSASSSMRRRCKATRSCCARRSPTWCTTRSSTRNNGGRVTVRTGQRDGQSLRRGRGRRPRHRAAASASACSSASTACRARRGTGSGLGLAIVREIAGGHGARIDLTDGAGATRLPSCANISPWIGCRMDSVDIEVLRTAEGWRKERPARRARHDRPDLGLGAAAGGRDGGDPRRRPDRRLGLRRLRRGRPRRQGAREARRGDASPSSSPTASPTRRRRAGACPAAARCSW